MPLNEGQTVQYTVTTTNTADGTVLYWKTTGNTTNSDIVGGNTGTITITNNRATFNVTVANDVTTDYTKTLGISISTGSQSGPTAVSTANPILVNDTSQDPASVILVWGSNFSGVLGTNDEIHRSSPTQIGGTNWKSISINGTATLALDNNNKLWSWGSNGSGQLGQNNTISRSSPIQVGTDNWSGVLSDSSVSMAKKSNGTLWTWGGNGQGQLGHNDVVDRSSPTQVGTDTNWNVIPLASKNNAFLHSVATKTDGTIWVWGWGSLFNHLGLGVAVDKSSPTQIGSLTNWPTSREKLSVGYAMTGAIKPNGTLHVWGANWSPGYPFGLNGADAQSPTQVGSNTNWATISVGYLQMAATKTDGTLWTWGRNDGGQLGQNDRIDKSSPVQVGTDTNWYFVQVGSYGGLGVKTNGTLWAWGRNNFGIVGQNNTIYRSSPVQVGTDSTWPNSYEKLAMTGLTPAISVIRTQ